MSKSYTIVCDELLLSNPYGSDPVKIKNKKYTDPIEFDSGVTFKRDIKLSDSSVSLQLGKFKFEASEDGETLYIKKNDAIIFVFSD